MKLFKKKINKSYDNYTNFNDFLIKNLNSNYENNPILNDAISKILTSVSELFYTSENKNDVLFFENSVFSDTFDSNMSLFVTDYLLKGASTLRFQTSNNKVIAWDVVEISKIQIISPSRILYGGVIYQRSDVDLNVYTSDDAIIVDIKRNGIGYCKSSFFGISVMSYLRDVLCQLTTGDVHNSNLLKNNGRVSGVLNIQGLPIDVSQNVSTTFKDSITGAKNAGSTLITNGDGVSYTQLGYNNLDMDYSRLVQRLTSLVYSNLGIPTPLIDNNHQTYNNYTTARATFYLSTVIPLIRVFLNSFNKIAQTSIHIDVSELPSLQALKTDSVKKMSESNILTVNELRDQLGYSPVDGGDVLFVNRSQVPFAEAIMGGV